ncbi:MAG: hypothetical protein IMZ52_10180 [Actinobacteria bacterium]|nr:hypothetical protein [Actinomycetota bacterium]
MIEISIPVMLILNILFIILFGLFLLFTVIQYANRYDRNGFSIFAMYCFIDIFIVAAILAFNGIITFNFV